MSQAERRKRELLERAEANGVEGGRFVRSPIAQSWIGESLWWVPDSQPISRPFYSVISSRMGRQPHRRPRWFRMLERAVQSAEDDRAALICVDSTAVMPWVNHAGKLFKKTITKFRVSDWKQDCGEWIDQIQQQAPDDAVHISPPINPKHAMSGFPRRDVFATAAGAKIFVAHVTSGGHIDRLVQARLADETFPMGSVWVAAAAGDKTSKRLIDKGAVGWLAGMPAKQSVASAEPDTTEQQFFALDQLLAARGERSDSVAWPYLVHCTRERTGPWPSQSEDAFRDEMVLSLQRFSDTGALGTLNRIIESQQLLGNDRVTRGDTKVVCFSENPLTKLLAGRTYRQHLGRWDYEPYGIAIRKQHLHKSGCQRVVYGNDSVFNNLSLAQRPFFQSQGNQQDWTAEREWRSIGNVDLSAISADDAFVFVPSTAEAKALSAKCRWPIVVVSV